LFKSFFLAGFECATGYNRHGDWIDQVAATHHDRCADEDYRLLREVGIRAARESIRWPLVDRRGRYDFSSVGPLLDAGREHGVQVIWDLFHYGYPDDVDLFSDAFPARFEDYCRAAASWVAARSEGRCYFTPINEPSYFSWAAGEAGFFAPHQTGRAYELKVALARAAIRGIDAIRDACPNARIVNADPLCRVVAPVDTRELDEAVLFFNDRAVFESWDMLSGRMLPELGGSPAHLDVVGINYYWTNQWEVNRPEAPLEDDDPRRASLRELVRTVHQRYPENEILITETSHRDEMRPVWLRELTGECDALLAEGVPLRGVCLYPILGMPEWHAQEEWTRMGLWDLHPGSDRLDRVLCKPMLRALREARHLEHAFRKAEPVGSAS
jgi:beta-glucosidase/6-phospho-beta-glucosidase/beta-galactosidase